MRRPVAAVLFASLFLTLSPLARADEYTKVEAAELAQNPQMYWARGIVFSDVLEAVTAEKPVKLGDRRYRPVTLRALGTCYLESSLEDTARALPLGQEYVYAGSVYQKDAGLLFNKRRFFVVIKRISSPIKDTDDLVAVLQKVIADKLADSPFQATFRSLNDVLASAQKDLEAYSASSNLQLQALFAPDSPHANRVVQSIRQALLDQERASKVPIPSFTVNLLTALLSIRNGALAALPAQPAEEAASPVELEETGPEAAPGAETPSVSPAEPEPAVAPEPEPAPVVEEKAVPPAIESSDTVVPEAEPSEMPAEGPSMAEPVLEEEAVETAVPAEPSPHTPTLPGAKLKLSLEPAAGPKPGN